MKMIPFVLLCISIQGAWCQSVPQLINYQGRLANADGSPFPTADYELRLSLYDAPTNGNLIWGPQIFDGAAALGHGPKIPVVQGYFNLMLGPADTNGVPIPDAFAGPKRFVEVSVGHRPPMLPRQQILSTPYSFRSGWSDSLDPAYVRTVLIPEVMKTPLPRDSVGTEALGDQSVTQSKLASRVISSNAPAGGIGWSRSSGQFSVGVGPSFVGVSNLSVTIETTGRPVFIGLIPDGSTNPSAVGSSSIGNPRLEAVFQLTRNEVPIAVFDSLTSRDGAGYGHLLPAGVIQTVDIAPAGALIYRLLVRALDGNAILRNVRLIAYEL